jgi:hypothetical protein
MSAKAWRQPTWVLYAIDITAGTVSSHRGASRLGRLQAGKTYPPAVALFANFTELRRRTAATGKVEAPFSWGDKTSPD